MLSIRSTDPQNQDILIQENVNQKEPIQAKAGQGYRANDSFQDEVKEDKVSLGFIKRCANFLGLTKKSEQPADMSEKIENGNRAKPINYVPILEAPANMDPQLKNFKLPRSAEVSGNLSDEEIFDGLSQISDKTIAEIIMIVLKAQGELEREGMLLDLDTMDKFQKVQFLRQKDLQKIKQALLNDDKFLSIFTTTQKFAIIVGAVATLFSMPIFIGAVAAGVAALSAAGKSYSGVRLSENQAEFTRTDHQMKITKDHMDETSNRMQRTMESKNDKHLSEFLKNMIEMARMINS